jgi:hypothetical protein
MVAGLWRIRDLEEYNMFIFIKVLVVFTKNAQVVCTKSLASIGIFV